MVLCPELVEEDSAVPADVRTMREFVKMGSSVNPDIELTGDAPSLHASGKMPALDTQLWIEHGKILYEHYRKPMANPLVMLQCSAMPAKVKRTTLTQEAVRILKNTSRALPWDTAAGHLSDLSARMLASGYDEEFRHQVIKAGVAGFEKMVKVEEEGGRPVNRPRSWQEDSRQRDKYHKGLNWYRSGGHHVPLFVPHTPGSELARRMRRKEEENNQGRSIRFLICEMGGERVFNHLWRPNPWLRPKCGRPDCFPCRGERGGNCWVQGVTYTLGCETCSAGQGGREVAAYKGETGKNAYDRGKQHLTFLEKKNERDSVLWLHSLHHHGGRDNIQYTMRVTGQFRQPLDRQIAEKVQISRFNGDILMNRKNELGGAVVERERYKYRRWGSGPGAAGR
jgi:hypothetical protein